MSTRVIIYSGKGGTGKTTISAATASLLASQGRKVLVMSSDPAHSLSDVFGQAISRDELTKLAPNLFGLEIDTVYEMRKRVGSFEQRVAKTYQKHGVSDSAAAELSSQPGMDEILALDHLMTEYQSGNWDCIVLDTAPTGNTLRLLAYPEIIIGGESGKQMLKTYQRVGTLFRPFQKGSDKDDFTEQINRIMDLMGELSQFIVSSDVTMRLVLNPEKLPVMETKRAYTFLSLYGVTLDACIINKILPVGSALGPYFDYWTELQAKYIKEVEDSFQPMPVLKSILEGEEPIGVDKLKSVAERLAGETDLMQKLYGERLLWLEDLAPVVVGTKHKAKTNSMAIRRLLCLHLPFLTDQTELQVRHESPELHVVAGRLERSLSLPRALLQSELERYYYEDDTLKLEFIERPLEEREREQEEKAKEKALDEDAILWQDDPFFENSGMR